MIPVGDIISTTGEACEINYPSSSSDFLEIGGEAVTIGGETITFGGLSND